MLNKGKLVIFSAPSGSGKTTIVKHLLQKPELKLEFSISATSREPREGEVHGKDYYFLSKEDFESKIASDDFIEYEEVYAGTYYGTLKSEIDRIWEKGNHVAFDIDVVGGDNLKKMFTDKALAIFVQPPSIEELRNRLKGRGTETEEKIQMRIDKAEFELSFVDKFDTLIINDDLELAQNEAYNVVQRFIES
jgi:guanylate kinase